MLNLILVWNLFLADFYGQCKQFSYRQFASNYAKVSISCSIVVYYHFHAHVIIVSIVKAHEGGYPLRWENACNNLYE